MTFPLLENDFLLGEVGATVVGQNVVAIDGDRLQNILEPVLSQATLLDIEQRTAANGFIETQDLEDLGLNITFDFQDLALDLVISGRLRKSTDVSVNQRGEIDITDKVTPGFFSGYINGFAVQDYLHEAPNGNEGRAPFSLTIDGALNFFGYKGLTLEGEGFYAEGEDNEWTRGDVRLIHDNPDHALRYTAGDIEYFGSELQGTPALGGFSIERNYSELQPLKIVTPSGQRQFTLDRAATVDVYVNGGLTRTIRLDPGNINLEDFNFLDGANDVVLEIEDAAGRTQRIEFTSFFDNDLLAKGLSEFSYNIGYPSFVEDNEVKYNEDQLTLSGFHSWGLTDNLTFGINAQGNEDIQQAGLQFVWATSFGNFDIEPSVSLNDRTGQEEDLSPAVNFDWEYNFKNDYNQVLDVSLEAYDHDFVSLSDTVADNPYSYDAQMRFQSRLPYDFGGTLTARHANGRGTQGDITSVGTTLNRSFGRASAFASFDYINEEGQADDVRALLSVSFRLGERQTLLYRRDTLRRTTTAEWTRFRRNVANDWGANIAINDAPNDTQVTGELEYAANRFDASVEHTLQGTSFSDSDLTEQRSRMRLSSSIAFADGHFGFGRPVDSSFALVHAHDSLDGADIAVNKDQDGKAVAWADGTGPAIVPDIAEYRPETLTIELENAPVGYNFGDARYDIVAARGSGVGIEIGSDASVMAIGILTDAEGNPLSLAAGTIIPAGAEPQDAAPADAGEADNIIFTNQSGRFVAQGIKPGNYTLNVRDQNLNNYSGSFTVPKDAKGYVKIGEIKLNAQ